MKPPNDEPYEKAYQQVINDYEKYIWQKYHVRIEGLGGGASETHLRHISIYLNYKKSLTIEEGRKLFINCFEELKTRVNSSEELKPYLEKYPFTNEEFSFGLSMQKRNPLAFIFLGKNNAICYSTDDENNIKLEIVFKEPYEEALNIVNNTNIAKHAEIKE